MLLLHNNKTVFLFRLSVFVVRHHQILFEISHKTQSISTIDIDPQSNNIQHLNFVILFSSTSRWLSVTPSAFPHLRHAIRMHPSRPSSRNKRGVATRSTWTKSWDEATSAKRSVPIHLSLWRHLPLSRYTAPFRDTATPLLLVLCHSPHNLHHHHLHRLQCYHRSIHRARLSSHNGSPTIRINYKTYHHNDREETNQCSQAVFVVHLMAH